MINDPLLFSQSKKSCVSRLQFRLTKRTEETETKAMSTTSAETIPVQNMPKQSITKNKVIDEIVNFPKI